jgi:hypothetical protein
MKLLMTLLVRDEEDVIRANIEYHLSQGVDFIIATDNRSSDGTTNILREYERRGVLAYIYEGADDYNQHAWVTRMAQRAYTEYGADWVINNDADEFWWPLQGTLAQSCARVASEVNILLAPRHNFAPLDTLRAPFYDHQVYRMRESKNPLGAPLPPKVAHRGAPSVRVAQGNHAVEGLENAVTASGVVEILHFPIRSYAQIENKIAKGGAAYARNRELSVDVGITWRKLYEQLQREGTLDAYFKDNVYDPARVQQELGSGAIVRDERLKDYFARVGLEFIS